MILDIEHKDVTYFLSPSYSDALVWICADLIWALWCAGCLKLRMSAVLPKNLQSRGHLKARTFCSNQACPPAWMEAWRDLHGTRQRCCMPGEGLPMFLLCKKGQNPGYSTFAQQSIVRPLSMPMYSYELHQQTNYNVKALRSSNTPWKNWTSPDNHKWLDLTRSCPAYFPLF